MPEPVPQYELLRDDEPGAEPERTVTRANWRRIAAVTLVFVLGAAVGVAATAKQRDAAATRERRSTVSLTVVAAGWPTVDHETGRVRIGFRLRNNGPLPVQVEQVAVAVPGFQRGDTETRRRVLEIEPGRWASISAGSGVADCDAAPENAGTRGVAVLTVRSASGAVREISEPIESMDASAAIDAWAQVCQPSAEEGVWAYVTSFLDVTEVSGELVIPGELAVDGGFQVTVTGLVGTDLIDMRGVEALGPIEAGQTVSVQFAVRRCPSDDQIAEALEAPFTMRLTQGEAEMEIQIDSYNPPFWAQLVELITRVCGGQ